MSVTVRIPGPLRRYTDGAQKVEVAGADLGSIISEMESRYAGIKERLLDDDGEMRYFVNVYLNGEDVRFLEGLATQVKDGDELSIVFGNGHGGENRGDQTAQLLYKYAATVGRWFVHISKPLLSRNIELQ